MRTLDLDLPFAVTTWGEAHRDPVLVVPGGPCRGAQYLGDFADLGHDYPLVVLHPRGTPTSGGVSRGWWSDAADVIALADALDLPSIDLVAHSAGTRLALAVAAQFPSRVRSMALVTPPASWLTRTPSDAESIAAAHASPEARAALDAMSEDEPTTDDAFQDAWRRQAPAGYAHWTTAEQAHSSVGAVSLAAARAWFSDIPHDAVDRILSMEPPRSLVIGGDRDLLTGVQPVEDYAMALAAEYVLIKECGHYPWIEQPATLRRILGQWFATRE